MGCLDCIALEAIGRLHLALGTTEFLCLWTYVVDVIFHGVTMVLRGLQVLTAGLGDGIKVDTAFFNIQLSAMEKSQRWKPRAFSVLLFLFVFTSHLPSRLKKPFVGKWFGINRSFFSFLYF